VLALYVYVKCVVVYSDIIAWSKRTKEKEKNKGHREIEKGKREKE